MKTKDKNIHSGHRDRVRERAKQHGFSSFQNHELLEFILFYVIPRANTNPIAHNLINDSGNLYNMLSSGANELKLIDGVGENTALFIEALGELYRRAVNEKPKVVRLGNLAEVKEYVKNLFKLLKTEKLYAICLDKSSYVLNTLELSLPGKTSEAEVDIKQAISKILAVNPSFVVLAHNHVDDVKTISDDDGMLTTVFYRMLALYGISLFDHIIVCGDETISFKEKGDLDKIKTLVAKRYTNTEIVAALNLKSKVSSSPFSFDYELGKYLENDTQN